MSAIIVDMTWWGDRRTSLRNALPVPLVVVLLAAGVLQGLVLWRAHHAAGVDVLTNDSHDYIRLARALVADNRYLIYPGGPPAVLRSPGYPLFLALVWAVTPNSPWYGLVAQSVVAVVGLVLLYHLVIRVIGGPWVALAATAFVALDPTWILSAGRVLSETLFTALLLGFVLLCTGIGRTGRPAPRLLAAGTVLAAATFVRPTTYYLPVLVVALLLVAARRWRWDRRTTTTAIGAFLLPAVLLCGGWQIRNHLAVGTWTFAGVQNFNLYYFWAAPALAIDEQQDPAIVRDQFTRDVGTYSNRAAQEQRIPDRYPTVGSWYDDLGARGLAVLRAHPAGATRLAWTSAKRFMTATPDATIDRYLGAARPEPVRALQGQWAPLLLCAAAIGLVPIVRRGSPDRFAGILVVGAAMYLMVTSAGAGADTRFRVPITPLLAVVAAAGASATAATQRRVRRRRSCP